jgi:GTPase SAR1 family protein
MEREPSTRPVPVASVLSVDAEEAFRLACEGQSVLLVGPPGVGKSTLAMRIVTEIEKTRVVHRIARTHVCARNIEGETIDSFCAHTSNLASDACILVDEIFLCEVTVLAKLCDLMTLGVQLILTGDDCQCEPVRNHWYGSEMPESELERSDLLRLMAPVQCHLSHCWRSDHTIHDFCMRCRESADVDELITEARTLFTATGVPDWNLCVDNRTREEINGLMDGATGIDLGRWHMDVGARVIACQTRGGLKNKVLYFCTSLDPITVRPIDGGESVVLTLQKATSWLQPSHAITINCAQGRTLLGHVRIHTGRNGIRHRHFSKRRLLTAVSRATRRNLVSVK